jgi:hypothetical protein
MAQEIHVALYDTVAVPSNAVVRGRRCCVQGTGPMLTVHATDSVLMVSRAVVWATRCVVIGDHNSVRGKGNYIIGKGNMTDDARALIDIVKQSTARNVVCFGWDRPDVFDGVWHDVTLMPVDGVAPQPEITRRFMFARPRALEHNDQPIFSSIEARYTDVRGPVLFAPPPPFQKRGRDGDEDGDRAPKRSGTYEPPE